MRPFRFFAPICFALFMHGWADAQQNWPQFRGEDARGLGNGRPPTHWNIETGENVLWSTEIEGLGHSAPIVWADSIFVTTATSDDEQKPSLQTGWIGGSGEAAPDSGSWKWKVVCLDRTSGKIRWSRTAVTGEPEVARHLKASHANCTPATDGSSVVAFFGSEGLYCYDFEGNLKWKRNLGRLHSGPYNAEKLEWGFASSPIIHRDRVIVQCDCLNAAFVAIFDLQTGKEVKRIEREDVSTWSTPCVVEFGKRSQIVCNGFKQMAGYDFDSGELLWTLRGGGDVPVPTPLFQGNLIFITNGHGRSPVYAVSADARGDVTPKDEDDLPDGLVWYQPRGGSYMPTPILVGKLLYSCNDNGVLTVREAATGDLVYRQRVSSGSQNTYSASAVATKEHLYFSSESGKIVVAKTGKQYTHVTTNDMQAVVMATPAMADDQLFVRTVDGIVCIGEKPAGKQGTQD